MDLHNLSAGFRLLHPTPCRSFSKSLLACRHGIQMHTPTLLTSMHSCPALIRKRPQASALRQARLGQGSVHDIPSQQYVQSAAWGHISFPQRDAPVFGRGRQHAVELPELAVDGFQLGDTTIYNVGCGWDMSKVLCRLRAIHADNWGRAASRDICSRT